MKLKLISLRKMQKMLKPSISLKKLKNKLVQPNQNLPNQNGKLKTLIEDLSINQIKKATTIN